MAERLIPIENFYELKEGDTVRCVARDQWHTHWNFRVGQDYQVKKYGNRFVPMDGDGDGISSEYFGHKFARVVSDGEVAEKKSPVRYMYVVSDASGFIDATPDRDEARETKVLFGGKANGVIITAYAPVKEIR